MAVQYPDYWDFQLPNTSRMTALTRDDADLVTKSPHERWSIRRIISHSQPDSIVTNLQQR
jgi:hypothetical protein